jgi:hypothetical protein
MKAAFALAAGLALMAAVARADFQFLTAHTDNTCTTGKIASATITAGSCNAIPCTALGGQSTGYYKSVCMTGTISLSALPVIGGSVSASYSDSGCTTLTSASVSSSCVPGSSDSFTYGCTATNKYMNSYTSTDCTGTPTQLSMGSLSACAADSYNAGSYTKQVCLNPVPMAAVTSGYGVAYFSSPNCKGTIDTAKSSMQSIPFGACMINTDSKGVKTSTKAACSTNGVVSITAYTDTTCSAGASDSSPQICGTDSTTGASYQYWCCTSAAACAGNPPAVAAPTSAVVLTHWSDTGCKGKKSDTPSTIPMTWGVCKASTVNGKPSGSAIYNCKNGAPSVTSYTCVS